MSVVIENDFNDTPCHDCRPPERGADLGAEELVKVLQNAGVVGMGGATFPTHIKISSGLGKVDTVIINASECEPYITSDHRLLLEYPEEIIGGAKILARIFGVDRVHIGVEANKQNAAELLRVKIDEQKAPLVVDMLHTRYPQGAEKQLCQSITGRQVPPGPCRRHRLRGVQRGHHRRHLPGRHRRDAPDPPGGHRVRLRGQRAEEPALPHRHPHSGAAGRLRRGEEEHLQDPHGRAHDGPCSV